MTALTAIDAYSLALTSTIPYQWTSLTNLQQVYVSSNAFTGMDMGLPLPEDCESHRPPRIVLFILP